MAAKDAFTWREFTGLRNGVASERFAPGELEVATNVEIDESGALSRRPGYVKRYTGAPHSLWTDGQKEGYFVEGGVLKRLNTDWSAANLRTLRSNDRLAWAAVADRRYFASSTDTGVIEAGVPRSWGLPVAPSLAVTASAGGALTAGEYQCALTWLRADGQEGGTGVATRVTCDAGSKLTFTIPAAPNSEVVGATVYASGPNGETLYQVAVTTPGATVTYSGDIKLAWELQTQFCGPAPFGHLVGYHAGRTYIAQGDLLYPSRPMAPELFDLREFVQADARVTLHASVDGEGYFLGTDRSVSWVQGTGGETSANVVQRTDYGAIEGALSYVDGSFIGDGALAARMVPVFLTQQGLCAGLPGGEIRNLTRAKYQFTAQGRGCSLFRADSSQLVAVTTF